MGNCIDDCVNKVSEISLEQTVVQSQRSTQINMNDVQIVANTFKT